MARLNVYQNNYGRWGWSMTGRSDSRADFTSSSDFQSRELSLENAEAVLGREVDDAHLSLGGISDGAFVPPFPTVDRKTEAYAAGFGEEE